LDKSAGGALAGCAIAVEPSRATVKAAISGVRNIENVSTGLSLRLMEIGDARPPSMSKRRFGFICRAGNRHSSAVQLGFERLYGSGRVKRQPTALLCPGGGAAH
jgi:hypothetical protein